MKIKSILINFVLFANVYCANCQTNTNSFPSTGNASIGSLNILQNSRMYYQGLLATSNNYTRGNISNNMYWDNTNSLWTTSTASNSDFGMIRFENGGNISFFVANNSGAVQTFSNTDLENYRMLTIKNNGKVGIGTSNPQELLSVNGTILTKKIRVSQTSTDWPDYVFDKGYTLMSLDSLDNYLQKYHHLPDLASADEIANTGVDLGANQKMLLQKIEELTLYIISQNKQITNESEKVKQLNQELANQTIQINELKTELTTQQQMIDLMLSKLNSIKSN